MLPEHTEEVSNLPKSLTECVNDMESELEDHVDKLAHAYQIDIISNKEKNVR